MVLGTIVAGPSLPESAIAMRQRQPPWRGWVRGRFRKQRPGNAPHPACRPPSPPQSTRKIMATSIVGEKEVSDSNYAQQDLDSSVKLICSPSARPIARVSRPRTQVTGSERRFLQRPYRSCQFSHKDMAQTNTWLTVDSKIEDDGIRRENCVSPAFRSFRHDKSSIISQRRCQRILWFGDGCHADGRRRSSCDQQHVAVKRSSRSTASSSASQTSHPAVHGRSCQPPGPV